MNHPTRLSFLIVTLIAIAPLRAATQVEQIWAGYGGNGFFNWAAKDTTSYDAAKLRSDTERDRLLSKTPELRTEIERLDLDKRWELDVRKKRYTEVSISEARAKMEQELEKNRQDYKKRQKSAGNQKAEEAPFQIKSATTKVAGPGAPETINGFDTRPYVVTTVIEFETVADHKPLGKQTLYEKVWTSDSPQLAQYQKDAMAYWKSASAGEKGKPAYKELMAAMQSELDKAKQGTSANPFLSQWAAVAKIDGYPVRTLMGFTLTPMSTAKSASPSAVSQDEGVVQASDLSNGLSGLASGIASRWVSKKVAQKVDDKMAEHPVWIDEVSRDLSGAGIGWGWMTEIKSVHTVDSSSGLFDLPVGFKKVKSL